MTTEHIISAEPEQSLVVSRRTQLTADIVEIELTSPRGEDLPDWSPGAHIDLVLSDELTRQYSLCGDRSDRKTWRVAVLNAPGGRGGSALVHDSVREGSPLLTRGPRNHFEFEPAGAALFIAGGIGITPLIPMIAEAQARGIDWRLYYGGRSRATMAFADDLVAAYGSERVTLVPEDELGFIDLDTLLVDTAERVDVYCCGPAPLLDAVESRCASWVSNACHTERFTPKPIDHSGDSEFEVELSSSGQVLRIPPQCSILEILENSGIFVPASCREGTCGTCETGVEGGIPDHRDSVLDEDERAANDSMMICVSRSQTPRLTLNL